jgi:putative transport protein
VYQVTWLQELVFGSSIQHDILVYCAVAACGLALGSVRIRGLGIGIAGVMFSGLLFAHFGLKVEGAVLEFAQQFGLILFVYTIGMQVGPGFFASLQRQGLPLNLLAAGAVVVGAVLTGILALLSDVPVAALAGVYSGAITNTPALGAAQQALRSLPGSTPELVSLPGLGYAVAYPFGVLGIIGGMLLMRSVYRTEPQRHSLTSLTEATDEGTLSTLHLAVNNPNLAGLQIRDIPGFSRLDVVVSRIRQGAHVSVATPDTVLAVGDVLLAVGKPKDLDELRVVVGCACSEDLRAASSALLARKVVVTRKEVVGKRIRDLAFLARHNAVISRVTRAETELTARPDQRLKFGDFVTVVSDRASIAEVMEAFGNSVNRLHYAEVIPIFLGIGLGVVLGMVPLSVGLPAPVRLGLAGGPLLVAIALSRIGRVGPLNWYLPSSANLVLREIGIVLFLASVGLRAGDHFLDTLVRGDGLTWMAMGALITLLPLLTMALVARYALKLDYGTLCGLMAGSTTDPPALAFATAMGKGDAPSVSYSTVYPLTMVLRVLSAQLLVLLLV